MLEESVWINICSRLPEVGIILYCVSKDVHTGMQVVEDGVRGGSGQIIDIALTSTYVYHCGCGILPGYCLGIA